MGPLLKVGNGLSALCCRFAALREFRQFGLHLPAASTDFYPGVYPKPDYDCKPLWLPQ
jgi:hypothetical protein